MKKKLNDELYLFVQEFKKNIFSINKNFKAQIPNLITLIRLILLPFIIFHIFLENFLFAGVLTIIAVFSDLFDGFFARKFNVVTSFGGKLDSISDKIFTIFILAALIHINYYIIIPILLDIIIGIVNGYFVLQGKNVKTSRIGKIKTLFLGILICSLFFTDYLFINSIIQVTLIIVILLQLITLFYYFRKYYRI